MRAPRQWGNLQLPPRASPGSGESTSSQTSADSTVKDVEFGSRLRLVRDDITKLKVDVVVNAANNALVPGGGVDGAIHRAAGRELADDFRRMREEAQHRGPSPALPTAGPIYDPAKGQAENDRLLRLCYERCLTKLAKLNLREIAFPCISAGVYGFPLKRAAQIAVTTAWKFLREKRNQDSKITFCVFDQKNFLIYSKLLQTQPEDRREMEKQ